MRRFAFSILLILAQIVFDLPCAHAITLDQLRDMKLDDEVAEVCTEPASSPICAVKTWLSCYLVQHEHCKLVGVQRAEESPYEAQFKLEGPVQGTKPWTTEQLARGPWELSWAELAQYTHSGHFGVNSTFVVGPERFSASPALSSSLIGTYEVILLRFPRDASDIEESIFLKELDGRWVVVSFHERVVKNSHSCICNPRSNPPNKQALKNCPHYAAKCSLFAVGVKPLALTRTNSDGTTDTIK